MARRQFRDEAREGNVTDRNSVDKDVAFLRIVEARDESINAVLPLPVGPTTPRLRRPAQRSSHPEDPAGFTSRLNGVVEPHIADSIDRPPAAGGRCTDFADGTSSMVDRESRISARRAIDALPRWKRLMTHPSAISGHVSRLR